MARLLSKRGIPSDLVDAAVPASHILVCENCGRRSAFINSQGEKECAWAKQGCSKENMRGEHFWKKRQRAAAVLNSSERKKFGGES